MRLYGSMPPVLAELVANAWDADATRVEISLSDDQLTIEDDGLGMTREQVAARYLTVGYQRRQEHPQTLKFDRLPMGRKGIGKLSTFSIADVVTVITAHDSITTAFLIDAKKLREKMAKDPSGDFEVDELDNQKVHQRFNRQHGTRVELTQLHKSVNQPVLRGLRQRLARRFSVIGGQKNFEVWVDGTQIEPTDRGYDDKIEFYWFYGADTYSSRFKKSNENQSVRDRTGMLRPSLAKLRGWIGTVYLPSQLKVEGEENQNSIAVYMRGKIAQHNLLEGFSTNLYAESYFVGELHFDELDEDDKDDIATTNRQQLSVNDPRVSELREFIKQELFEVAQLWGKLRAEFGAEQLAQEVPEVRAWLESMPKNSDLRKQANKWIGKLNALKGIDEGNEELVKRELLKASILAFEVYRNKSQLSRLDEIGVDDIPAFLLAFDDIQDLDRSFYGQIVKQRLAVIKQLQRQVEQNDYEKIIQRFLFKNLWLLDPGMERASGSEVCERTIGKYLDDMKEADLDDDARLARLDIAYRAAQSRHVIVELKRPSVTFNIGELVQQIQKYVNGVSEVVAAEFGESEYKSWTIEAVCLVGSRPTGDARVQNQNENILAALNARVVTYKELLDQTYKAYNEYITKHEELDRLWQIFDAIEDFAPEVKEASNSETPLEN